MEAEGKSEKKSTCERHMAWKKKKKKKKKKSEEDGTHSPLTAECQFSARDETKTMPKCVRSLKRA